MNKIQITVLTCLLLGLALPLSAYTVYLTDGNQLIAKEPPEIRGNTAIITLQNGTRTSLAATEIDMERTRRANQNELGSALVLEGGEFTAEPTTPETPKKERLSDLINRNQTRQQTRRSPQSPSSTSATSRSQQIDLLSWQRSPYRNLEIASEVQGVFRGQGVEQTRLYQGTAASRILIDVTADSEAAVFRGIKVAAAALNHLQTTFPGSVDAFELVLTTSNRSRAGQFLLDADDAAQLTDGGIELPTYYVQNVQF